MVLVTKDFLFTLTAHGCYWWSGTIANNNILLQNDGEAVFGGTGSIKVPLAQQVRDQEVLLLVCSDTTAPKESLKDTPQSGERLVVVEEVLLQQHTLLTMLL